MASLGRKSLFRFPLGGDIPPGPPGPSSFFKRISTDPTGIRFANLPLRYRGEPALDVAVSRNYSSTVGATMEPSDKADLSGVIRNKNWRPRSLIFS